MDKKLFGVLMGLLALVVCGAIVVLASRGGNDISQNPNPPVIESPAPAYTVREYNGSIGVFFGESATPALVYDIPVYTLPEADKLLLAEGIPANTEAELNSIIEDYTG